MNTWKVILATLVIFGAGFITGGLVVRHTGSDAATDSPTLPKPLDAALRIDTGTNGTNRYIPPPPQIPGMRKDFVKRLAREINLSPEQRERIEKIMAEGQEHIKELWDQISPQCHSHWVATQEKIRAELTEEQRKQFVEFMKNPRKSTPATNAPPAKISHPTTNSPATNTLPGSL